MSRAAARTRFKLPNWGLESCGTNSRTASGALSSRCFLHKHRLDPRRAAMFEDLARNLEVPYTLGMTTVLVVPEKTREVFREGWELEGRDAPHVDHVTDDLAGFLEAISVRRPSS